MDNETGDDQGKPEQRQCGSRESGAEDIRMSKD